MRSRYCSLQWQDWFSAHGPYIYLGASVVAPDIDQPLRLIPTKFCYFGAIVNVSMLKRVVIILTVVSLCLLLILMNVVNPAGIGPFGILIFFALLYMSLFGLVAYFIFILNRLSIRLMSILVPRKPLSRLSFVRACYYALVISFGPVILIGLRTVASMGPYQTLLTVLLVVIGCVYVSRVSNK